MVNKLGGVPVYRQVANVLRGRVVAGEYAPGDRIPSERELAVEFDISRPTVRQALDVLRVEGVLIAEHGRGVFVRSAPVVRRLARNRLSRQSRGRNKGTFLGDAADGGWTPSVSVEVRFEAAGKRVADLLGISAEAEVCVRDRVMRADDIAVQLSTSRFPRDLTLGTPIERDDTGQGGVYARLEDAGHQLVSFEEVVGARMPTSSEAAVLNVAAGTPVITVARVAYAGDRAVDVNDIVF